MLVKNVMGRGGTLLIQHWKRRSATKATDRGRTSCFRISYSAKRYYTKVVSLMRSLANTIATSLPNASFTLRQSNHTASKHSIAVPRDRPTLHTFFLLLGSQLWHLSQRFQLLLLIPIERKSRTRRLSSLLWLVSSHAPWTAKQALPIPISISISISDKIIKKDEEKQSVF